jgi:porphobilinogen synthase
VREPLVRPDQLIHPIFLLPGSNKRETLSSLPGFPRLSADSAEQEIEDLLELGVNSFIVFPAVPEAHKDQSATYSSSPDNFYLKAAQSWKQKYPEICLVSDVAMDPYSSDGHDGLVVGSQIDNDQTLPILAEMSLAQAQAGFDYLGPSDMMDGRVGFIRDALDSGGYTETGIISYTAKYASAFYGPFRHALDSAPREGSTAPTHKKSYQMDPANRREALLEAHLDASEGADMLMVKPAVHYMDIISDLRQNTHLPIACYHVSGECAMLLGAIERGWLDEEAIAETITSLGRAGADVLITYVARRYIAMLD